VAASCVTGANIERCPYRCTVLNYLVLSALIPVVVLIAIGFVAGKAGFMRAEATKDLSSLVFSVLTPALLFRTMSTVRMEQLDFKPVLVYFAAAIAVFAAVLVWRGLTRRAAVLALGCTFSNMLAIGTQLVSLAYGEAGLVTLLTLISVHALVLLTLATVVFELAVAREQAAAGVGEPRHMLFTVLAAVRSGIFHPVPLPIILGLLFAQTGLVLPVVLDRPLQLLGSAFGPLALVLVGMTLTQVRVGEHLRGALMLTVGKNLVLPAAVAALCLAVGLRGLPLTVMVVAASMPIGANVFMFSQRYEVAEDLITASMAVSTVLALLSISLVMALVSLL
jgi:malonate transporter and related proteins